ncbi:hypothetical protein HZ326_28070 [Fusarium oxysporum f. sp. albedinis]|nr:hypothetical protein HZ326_28070 [Fusarium oxysporum f. sp. albedinis]
MSLKIVCGPRRVQNWGRTSSTTWGLSLHLLACSCVGKWTLTVGQEMWPYCASMTRLDWGVNGRVEFNELPTFDLFLGTIIYRLEEQKA